jgi:hypothetical protein
MSVLISIPSIEGQMHRTSLQMPECKSGGKTWCVDFIQEQENAESSGLKKLKQE